MRLVARVQLLHAGHQVERGDVFDASERDAEILLGRGQAERAPVATPKKTSKKKTDAEEGDDDGA